jgi:phosphoglycolate phosphatase
MTYRLVIFDFDGTLADSADWFVRNLNPMAERFGFRQADEAEIERLRRLPNREIIRRLGVPKGKLPRIARHMR